MPIDELFDLYDCLIEYKQEVKKAQEEENKKR